MSSFKKVLSKVLTWFFVAISAGMMIFTIVSVTTFDRNDRNVFGYKAFIVLTDSMKATDFSAGDLIIVKNVDPTTLEVGDIIAYSSQDAENYGETITHKIRAKTRDANGDPGFITYGTTTGVDDEIVVTFPYINGKYVFHLAGVGKFFRFLKTTPGYIICILVPFLLLIGSQALNTIRLFRRYRKEQLAAMEEEKLKIEEERRKSEEMMSELMRLKAQLSGNNDQPPAVPEQSDASSAASEQPTEVSNPSASQPESNKDTSEEA